MLTGEKIILRALEPEDLEILYRWENDPENWAVTNTFIPFSKETLKNYIGSIKDIYTDKQFRFVIETIADKKPVGLIDFFEFDPFHLRAGIGILIAEKEERGKGFASESLKLAARYAKDTLGLKMLFCNITETNQNSLLLFKNNGFEFCGIKKDWFRNKDKWENELMMQYFL